MVSTLPALSIPDAGRGVDEIGDASQPTTGDDPMKNVQIMVEGNTSRSPTERKRSG
jgi:hypothetical protein